ncbi:MAG: hypothetical protein SGILL_009154, partial [Bacillariaceae sp.]
MKFLNTELLFVSLFGLAICQTEDDDDVRPAPPSIGADVPVTYFGPAPSTVQPELIGPHQLLTAGVLDEDAGTITLPLYKGRMYANAKEFPPKSGGLRSNPLEGETRQANGTEGTEGFPFVEGANVWYVLTDTTDEGAAKALGLNFASKLRFTANGNGARFAEYGDDLYLNFAPSSIVDFTPEQTVVPGASPDFFPPQQASAGAVGADDYSPIIYISNVGEFYNAPVVADRFVTEDTLNQWCEGIPDDQLATARQYVHDKVVAICPEGTWSLDVRMLSCLAFAFLYCYVAYLLPRIEQTVTLSLTPGHSFARPVLYLSMDAVDEGVAALEGATYAPGMLDITLGADDSFGSAVE